MIFGVLSDIHDQLQNLDVALAMMQEKQVEALVFCGDFCAPFAAKKLAEFGKPVHAILGNNDGDRFLIQKVTAAFPNFKLHGEYIGEEREPLLLDGYKIAATHYPFYAKPLAKTGWYDAVFYGHNHQKDKQKFGHCLLLNPGEIAGIFGSPSFALVNTAVRSSEIITF